MQENPIEGFPKRTYYINSRKIKKWARNSQYTLAEIAFKSRIDPKTLYNIMEGKGCRRPNKRTAKRLVDVSHGNITFEDMGYETD